AHRRLGALLVGCSGAVVLYATVIERQAPFFPFAALAVHALVRCGRRPSWHRGALLGAATGLTTLVHATGHLLFTLVVPWLLLGCERERGGMPAGVRALSAAVVVHGGLVLAAAGA